MATVSAPTAYPHVSPTKDQALGSAPFPSHLVTTIPYYDLYFSFNCVKCVCEGLGFQHRILSLATAAARVDVCVRPRSPCVLWLCVQ